MTINVAIGGRDPAYCTALGRVLLASRPEAEVDEYLASARLERQTDATVTDPVELRDILAAVASAGYALVDQEFEHGLVALAVPAHDSSGEVVAAVNISAYALRASAVVLEHEYLPLLQECVEAIEREFHPALRTEKACQPIRTR